MKRTILLVEDNPDDLTLLLRGIERTELDVATVVHENGGAALAWLHESGGDHHPLPALILLDIAQPQIDGVAFLQRLRADSLTRNTPVVIYSSCADELAVVACSASGCNSYVCKPVRYADFVNTVQQIIHYWLTLNTIPDYGME